MTPDDNQSTHHDAADQSIQHGLQRYRDGDLAGAETFFRTALDESPDRADATHMLGMALAGLGRPAEALPLLEAAILKQPDFKQYRHGLGNVQRGLNLNPEAEETFRKVLEIDPDDIESLHNLGELLFRRDQHPEALALLQRAIELRPDDGGIVNTLAAVMTRSGSAPDALTLLDNYSKQDSQCAVTRFNQASALADIGRIEDSEAAARTAISIEPDMAAAHWHLGLCRYDAGDTDSAIAALRRTVELAPGLALARAVLGLALLDSGRTGEGTTAINEAAARNSYLAPMLDGWHRLVEPATHPHGRRPRSFAFKSSHLRHALDAANRNGLFVELGVYMGRSMNLIADHVGTSITVHGFDSFEGLPEDWIDGLDKGSYDAEGQVPVLPENTQLHVGWFEDSLPRFISAHAGRLAFANIDCDIYSSTRTFFEHFGDRIEPGTVLVFDEFFCYPDWDEHEYKAFQEFVTERKLDYEYLALSAITRQATVLIT